MKKVLSKARLFPLLMLALSYSAYAVQTTNLLTNPGAETGDLTGWTAACISAPCTPPTVISGNNAYSGSYAFVSYGIAVIGTLTQTVTLAGVQGITAAEINSGELFAHVSFWEYGVSEASAKIILTFLSASNTVLGTVATPNVYSTDAAAWKFGPPCARCNFTFAIPPNTASITYAMSLLGGYSNAPVIVDDNFLSVSSSLLSATGADSVALGLQTAYVDAGPASYNFWSPSTGLWYGSTGNPIGVWGASADLPVIGDFDGDGQSDTAVYRPSNGYWYIVQSSNGEVIAQQWGEATDIPVAGDFDGDGKTDIAVYRPSTGYWFIIQSSNGELVAQQWGESTDIPVVGDFDGDGKSDIAVFRPSTGYWYIIQSSNAALVSRQWGEATDIPVAGDFDGDGKSDVAVFRPSNGHWYVVQSSDGSFVVMQFGEAGDIPVARDYDGDGKTDIAVFRPSTSIPAGLGFSYVLQSSNGAVVGEQTELAPTDVPVNSLSR